MIKCFDFNEKQFVSFYKIFNSCGITEEKGLAFEKSLNEYCSSPLVLDSNKLSLFLKREGSLNQALLAIRSCGWKIQGTDGVRANSDNSNLSAQDGLFFLTEKRKLTRSFCYNYSRAFTLFLENNGFTNKTIVIAEDGREKCEDFRLKSAVIQGICSTGWSVIDLNVVPTPLLVAYGVEKALPSIMITASHNPSSYNGLKLFQNGKKLYIEGEVGEFALSSILLQSVFENSSFYKESNVSLKVEEYPKKILTTIFSILNKELLKKELRGQKILLDAANGAYSELSKVILDSLDIEFTPVASKLGILEINENSGVAVLEELSPIVYYNKTSSNLVNRVIEEGRSSKNGALAIVMDGDGDRSFILKYLKESDSLRVYDGDMLGYCITNYYSKRGKGLFVSTIESDFSLENQIKREFGWKTETVCVGDRYLCSDNKGKSGLFIGIERSGHSIMPVKVNSSILLSGNGLLTALLAIESGLKTYETGFNYRKPIYECSLKDFYRESSLWKDVKKIVQNNPCWEVEEIVFEVEPDMLYFNLYSNQKESGRLYIRKSGTEPKINVCISVLKNEKSESSLLVQEIVTKLKDKK